MNCMKSLQFKHIMCYIIWMQGDEDAEAFMGLRKL